jgi:hypothetical protein
VLRYSPDPSGQDAYRVPNPTLMRQF